MLSRSIHHPISTLRCFSRGRSAIWPTDSHVAQQFHLKQRVASYSTYTSTQRLQESMYQSVQVSRSSVKTMYSPHSATCSINSQMRSFSRTNFQNDKDGQQENESSWTIKETDYGALEVIMNSNAVNCLNEKFFDDLLHMCITLDKSYPPHLPIVLRSHSEKVFSAGLDLPYVASLTKVEDVMNFVDELNRCFTRLYLLNRPTIAVVSNKHAIAGGLILAMCCDFQVVVTENNRAQYSLKEVGLGIPFPAQTYYIVEQCIGDKSLLKEMTLTAMPVTAEEGVKRGLFSHGVKSVDEVEPKIREILSRLDHEKSHEAYEQVKRLLKANPFREWMESTDTESSNIIFANCLLKDSTKELLMKAVGKK